MVILIVDDELKLRNSLCEILKGENDVLTCENGAEALKVLEKTSVDLVITDQQMPQITGLQLIKKGKEISPETAFMMMTAFGGVEQAVLAIKEGADDYFMKPFELSEFEHRVKRVLELKELRNHNTISKSVVSGLDRLVGQSASIQEAKAFISKVSGAAVPVLLLGPSGTGKEVMARAIHESGPRASRPFIAINCASLTENLMDSELFGHEKGAFTGAQNSKPGKFELARGGTLFLDEIGELSASIQAKLLRVLQEREFFRIGGVKQIKSDARVIAATHRDVKQMVKSGQFREDLFFRLNVLSFHLSPLSERREDLPVLVDYFWNKISRSSSCKGTLSTDTMNALLEYSYPGNIRELQNTLERLAVLGPKSGEIPSSLLPPEFFQKNLSSSNRGPVEIGGKGLEEITDELEREILIRAMEKSGHNQTQAAKLLKITRGALQYKLKRHGLDRQSA